MKLHRYWIELDVPDFNVVPGLYSCRFGVTAQDIDTSLRLLRDLVMKGKELPPIKNIVVDVDIS